MNVKLGLSNETIGVSLFSLILKELSKLLENNKFRIKTIIKR